MKYFLDTNIFVYQFDDQDLAKQERARSLVREALSSGEGICSSQVVNEFCNLAVRRFAKPMTTQQCQMYVDTVMAPLCTVGWSLDLVRDALRIVDRWQVAGYDSLIIAGATMGGAKVLWSEDMQDGMHFGSVRVRNPFRAS